MSDISKCPICETELAIPSSDKCSNIDCSFPLSVLKDPYAKLLSEKLIAWGKELYTNRSNNQYEPLAESDNDALQLENESLHPKIDFLNTLILQTKVFLVNIRIILFTQINNNNIDSFEKKRQEVKENYDKFNDFIKQVENSELAHLNQECKRSEIIDDNQNSQNKQDLQQIDNIQTQLQQELQKQIAPLQTQLQEVIKLLLFLQKPIINDNSQIVTSESIQSEKYIDKSTHHSRDIEGSRRQSIEDTRQEYSSSNTSLPDIPWLKAYNQEPESFEKHKPILLSITDDSIHQCRLGISQPIVLESTKKGNYWIFPEDKLAAEGTYLLPKANLKINEYSLETIKFLFKISEENVGNYTKLIVIHPALVIPLENGKWQLKEQGILQFKSD